jgi:hypothetical protein
MNEGSSKLHGAIDASRNCGETWELRARISREGDSGDSASPTSGNVDEPAIACLPSGRLFLVSRPDGAYFYSADRGRTWTQQGRLVEKSVFKAPRVFVLSDGAIVCACTYRHLQVFVGRAEGAERTGPLNLDETSYGYPGGILLDDESMLVSYNSSGLAPNSLYVLRFRLNKERNAIQLLPAGE